MNRGKISKRLISIVAIVVLIVVLTVAVLKVVPLKRASNSYDQSLTASPQSPATTTLALKRSWFVFGSLSVVEAYFPNIVSLYVFEPDGRTLVLSGFYDCQHSTLYHDITFNFTANVEGNFVFLMNGTFLPAPPPPYEFQPKVTMRLEAHEIGMTTIL